MSISSGQLRQLTVVLIASPPGVNDDALQNYMVGSTVYSISDQTFYECSDNTPGAAVWGAVSFGGGTPGGSDGDVQFNDGGVFGGEADFHWDDVSKKLSVNGNDSMTVNGTAITTHLQVHGDDGLTETEVELHRHGATAAAGATLYGARSRGSEATPTVVQDADTLLSLIAVGFDGTDYATAARIRAIVNGTPGNNDMPGAWIFETSADGGQTLTERMRIKQDGAVNIDGLTASRGVLADASKNLKSDGIGETRAAYNSTTQAVTSATETDITALVLSVGANKKYLVEIAIATECSGTSGIVFGHKFPAGSTFKLTHSGRTNSSIATMNLGNVYTANTGLINNPVNTNASATGSYVASCLLVTTNSGNYQLTFASVNGAQTSTIREYGHIKLTEIP